MALLHALHEEAHNAIYADTSSDQQDQSIHDEMYNRSHTCLTAISKVLNRVIDHNSSMTSISNLTLPAHMKIPYSVWAMTGLICW
jgi:hypothetical protein